MDETKLSLRIKNMTAETVLAVSRIEQLCFSSPWSMDSLKQELSNPLAVFRTAETGGEIIGYVGMHHVIDEGYITNIAIAPEYRRKGVAKALMQDLLDYAHKNGLHMITLEVRESNEPAQSLYESLGFEKNGRRKSFYTLPAEDGIIMTREF